ncbi:hypothetical protein SBA3_200020 [Candidatus Sulfopaludibacter sp. SbA3]|nr:hypothetical protein SBA3_200020 [Candidatus Sulfopaludibacter sp. SbA3]
MTRINGFPTLRTVSENLVASQAVTELALSLAYYEDRTVIGDHDESANQASSGACNHVHGTRNWRVGFASEPVELQ